jgi:hypothetical protein
MSPGIAKKYLEICFTNEEDYEICKTYLSEVCVISYPPLDQDYLFVENIGSGSQATVDLYKSLRHPRVSNHHTPISSSNISPAIGNADSAKSSANIAPPRLHRVKYAVKKYKILKSKDETQYDIIFNEIIFLRELNICENIVQLESVYIQYDKGTGE